MGTPGPWPFGRRSVGRCMSVNIERCSGRGEAVGALGGDSDWVCAKSDWTLPIGLNCRDRRCC